MARWQPNREDIEKALAFLDSEALRERARSWLRIMLSDDDYWQAGGSFHLHGHWVRVLVHALVIGANAGLPESDLDALCAAAIFHDTRRKNSLFDVGNGARGAAHYTQACLKGGPPFDERAYLAIAWHDRSDAEGERAIRVWADEHGHDAAWIARALLLYRVFKDADGLDRVRLGDAGPDARFLHLGFSKGQVAFAWELLDAFPFSAYESREDAGISPLATMGTPVSRLYVQSIDQELPPQDTDAPEIFNQKIARLAELVRGADAAVADFAADLPVGKPYRQLARLLAGKQHFVLKSNVDGQVPRIIGSGGFFHERAVNLADLASSPCSICGDMAHFDWLR